MGILANTNYFTYTLVLGFPSSSEVCMSQRPARIHNIVVPEKPTLNHIWGISKTFIIIASNLDPWSGSFGIFYDLAL